MKYKDFDIRTSLCNKVGHKHYQFSVNGIVVYETDDAPMYDALSGNEDDWDEQDYERAEDAARFLADCYIELLESHSNDIVMS